MTLFVSKPTTIEAIQFCDEDFAKYEQFAPGKVRIEPSNGALMLLAGKDGAQEWVPVPLGHWLVNQPGDKSDIWPVDPDYFAAKYDEAERQPDRKTTVYFKGGPHDGKTAEIERVISFIPDNYWLDTKSGNTPTYHWIES